MASVATTLESPPAVKMASLDIRRSAVTMGTQEARYLVDLYYQMQEYRKSSANQTRAILNEPHALIAWSTETFETVEKSIKYAMGRYAQAQRPGEWAMSIHGIGPVIAAGLLAHIDVHPWKCAHIHQVPTFPTMSHVEPSIGDSVSLAHVRCTPDTPHDDGCGYLEIQTAGSIHRFAGLDPTMKWEKGQKRPWNARLKVLAWKIGDSFMKNHNSPKCFYGKIYEAEKAKRVAKNERGEFADLAARTLEEKNFKNKQVIETYKSGRLPDGRIEQQAQRKAAKLFLAHYFEVAYECHYGKRAPGPYAIEIQKHADYIAPPNWSRKS